MSGFANDPAGFIDALERQAADMRARAEAAEEALQAGVFTGTSRDSAVTVTVNGGGALTAIEFGAPAEALTRAELAATVLEAYGNAAAEADRTSRRALAGLLGREPGALGLDPDR